MKLVAALALWCVATAVQAFGFADVAERARQSAAAPYQAPAERLSPALRELDYDQYREIRFKPESALWRSDKLPFELMFFHMGRAFRLPVKVNEVSGTTVKPVAFNPDEFDYGHNKLDAAALRDAGLAGFRVHYAVNTPKAKDEVLVFLGASYIRGLGKDQSYGLSARGLAVDTAGPSGEEFPRFTEFWVEKPGRRATELVIHALLDSPRVTGAYRFVLKPGTSTLVDVESRLYARAPIEKLGIAPLTSMYLFGENQPGRDDFRPEVHDSDGLSIAAGNGEWIWRPLVNPQRLLVTSFATRDPKGFGLMQRDRAFSSYEDPEAHYHRRPSLWIEPRGNWGEGRVELVLIPTPDETNDNVVAYWVGNKPLTPQAPLEMSYRMHWQAASETRPPTAWVVQSRRGRGFVRTPDGDLKFVIDFEGPALRSLPAGADPEAVVSIGGNATLSERNLYRNPVTGQWRMTVRFKRTDENKPVELRAYIGHDQKAISETWSYIVPPRTPQESKT